MIDKLYYWGGHKNFGDELSLYLVEKITNRKFKAASVDDEKLIAIGSLLENRLLRTKSLVWGTGTLTGTSIVPPKKKIFPLRRFCQTTKYLISNRFGSNFAKFYAVRGPLTATFVRECGFNCPSVYGDPAVLLPRYFSPSIEKEYNVGLILHHTQENFFDKKILSDYGIRLISILREGNQDIEDFVTEVCSCERIFSTSLHGLIIAQAYGINAQWIRLANFPIHGDECHKFYDYFLGVNQPIQEPLVIQNTIESISTLSNIHIESAKWQYNDEKLLDVFPLELP